ncbi:MAG: methylated-DNA--[protein]-cysteine S-methyltransferase [Caulobacteraceae bacterium]|nr:methylated-DNA--[protein]-cysteine S-methyltransferase [Caulobacteraceae bacterium]
MPDAFAIFDTAVGPCAVGWGAAGIDRVWLAEGSAAKCRERAARACPEAAETTPPAPVAAAIGRIQALLSGERDDLTDIELDWSEVPAFDRSVLEICRAIPPGETLTYGDIARRLGDLALSRGVGQALGRNPFPIIVPCHRVLGSDGKVGGFSANGGVETKLKMLTIERAKTSAAPTLFDDDPGFGFAATPRR